MFDFNTKVDRTSTGSIKIDQAPEPVKGSGLAPLTIADQEFRTAPAITDALINAARHGIYGYTYADEAYRSAVDSWMLRRHGWDTSGINMFTTNGVVTALGLAVRTFTEPGSGVVIQPPVYPPFAGAVRGNGRRIIENPLVFRDGRYEMDFDGLDEITRRSDVGLFILCSPHNPVGRVWSRDELSAVNEICRRNGVVVLSDEIHNDLIRRGHSHTVFASLDGAADNCIICTAVSKTFNLAGLACSNIFIPNNALADAFGKSVSRENTSCVPFFARAATIAAYNNSEEWLDALNGVLDENFEYLYARLDSELPMLRAVRAEGTYLAWIDMRALGLDDKALETLMLKHFLALDEGYIFGTNGNGFERWNLALPKPQLAAALDRLKSAVDSVWEHK